jgi:YVTN family beta-propeller protein
MNKLQLSAIAILLAVFTFTSCKKIDPKIEEIKIDKGAIILNEGNFMSGNASVSYYNPKIDSITNDIFYSVNSRNLGDVLQSAGIYNSNIYMVLNNSNKIEVANATNFEEITTIEGFSAPRYIDFFNNKAYVTQWGTATKGQVKVVDLSNNTITNTIEVGVSPEQILNINGNLYVANSGGFGLDSTISVIDASTNSVTKTIVVGHNPKKMLIDANGYLWVLCYGYVTYNPDWTSNYVYPSKLVKVDINSHSKISEFVISETQHPFNLEISSDKKTLYYGGGYDFAGIFSMNINSSSVSCWC